MIAAFSEFFTCLVLKELAPSTLRACAATPSSSSPAWVCFMRPLPNDPPASQPTLLASFTAATTPVANPDLIYEILETSTLPTRVFVDPLSRLFFSFLLFLHIFLPQSLHLIALSSCRQLASVSTSSCAPTPICGISILNSIHKKQVEFSLNFLPSSLPSASVFIAFRVFQNVGYSLRLVVFKGRLRSIVDRFHC